MEKSQKKKQKEEFETFYRDDYQVEKDTTCGYSVFRGAFIQNSATKNIFILINGFAGCLVMACFTYFSGSLSSIEKLYGIPSQKSGIISVGNDISQVAVGLFISYYLGNKHRPRWMAIGIICFSLYCFISVLPHLIYGTGKEILLLTNDLADKPSNSSTADFLALENQKKMCQLHAPPAIPLDDCENPENYMPQVILFIAQLIAGVGNAIYCALSGAYLDDNVEKAKAPWVISINHFIRMLGPALGFALASFCLKIFIEPTMTPVITADDPRWVGAWWIGMLILGVSSLLIAFCVSLFPKRMPRFVAKREFQQKLTGKQEMEKMISNGGRGGGEIDVDADVEKIVDKPPMSLADLWRTTMRMLKNKIFMLNLVALIFYFYGCFPYWIFLAKYMEVQYKTSASEANLYAGVVGIIFSAMGILLSGMVLSKYKPSARKIVMWNVVTTLCTALIFFSYNFMGCVESDRATAMTMSQVNATNNCNTHCHCDYVQYSPVCGDDGITYISPCHAGCTDLSYYGDSGVIQGLSNCSCVKSLGGGLLGGSATPGACKVDCKNWQSFYLFLAFVCLNNFLSSSGIAGSILIGVRSVIPEDKTFAVGFKSTMSALLAFIPSPIMFGALIDKACLFWGTTPCGENTNCWIYNGEIFRANMNTIASALMIISTLFNLGVWYYSKKLSIFDDKVEDIPKLSEKDALARGTQKKKELP